MSEQQTQRSQPPKTKGLGRGLGSLLSNGPEGAFSKTTPSAENALASLTASLPSQQDPAMKEGFVESSAAPPAPAPTAVAASTAAAAPAVTAAPTIPPQNRIWNLPIEKIFPNANQPRQIFEKEPLQELANSIREKGILQPIMVHKTADDEFEIIAGERRWRAAQIAGLKEVPAILRELPEREVLEIALIENIQRENLNPVEEAEAYDFIMKKYNLTQVEVAQKVGKDRVTVANILRLLNLQPSVRQMVSRGELSLGQAKVLLSVTDLKVQQDLAQRAKGESLSVRALEKLVSKIKIGPASARGPEDSVRAKAAQAVAEELQKLLGSKVSLDYDGGKGRLVVHFYSDSELNQLVDTLRDSWRK